LAVRDNELCRLLRRWSCVRVIAYGWMLRSSSIRAGLVSRARIVLLAADGLPNAEIARRAGTSRPTVVDWRARYDAGGINSLHDQPRSGRPAEIDEIDVVVATLADDGRPPARLGVTHWSARLLGAELGISFACTVPKLDATPTTCRFALQQTR
jgi:hypothetical protein